MRASRAPLVVKFLPWPQLAEMTGTKVAATHRNGVTVSLSAVHPLNRTFFRMNTDRLRMMNSRDPRVRRPPAAFLLILSLVLITRENFNDH